MLVPSCASANPRAMMKIPKRWPELAPSRNIPSKLRGFHTGPLLKITDDEDDTIIPMNEVTPNPMGMVKSCDHNASFGVRAKREKSGSFMISAAKLPMHDMIPLMTAHASVLPWMVFGWWTIGPMPWAREMAQAKKAMAAMGE